MALSNINITTNTGLALKVNDFVLMMSSDGVTTSTTTTTTTAAPTCNNYNIEGAPSIDVQWLECDGTPNSATVTTAILICAQTGSVSQTGGAGNITQLGSCTSPTTTTTTSTTTTTTTAATTSTTTTTTTAASFVLLAPVGGLAGTSSAACLNYLSSRSYYSTLNGFVSGVTTIYEDSSLTTPFNSGGQWKPMSFDGINIYAVITDSAGVVTTYTSC